MPFGSPGSPKRSGGKSPRSSLILVNKNGDRSFRDEKDACKDPFPTRDSLTFTVDETGAVAGTGIGPGTGGKGQGQGQIANGEVVIETTNSNNTREKVKRKCKIKKIGKKGKQILSAENIRARDRELAVRYEVCSEEDFSALSVSVRTVDIPLKGEEEEEDDDDEDRGDEDGEGGGEIEEGEDDEEDVQGSEEGEEEDEDDDDEDDQTETQNTIHK